MLTSSPVKTISHQLLTANRDLFLVFDRDGTLVPFENPKDAVFEVQLRQSLNILATRDGLTVGLLSARSIKELKEDLPDNLQILGGNYGLEIEMPGGGSRFCHPQAQEATVSLAQGRILLQRKMRPEYMHFLEDHGLSLCFHWHRTPKSLRQAMHAAIAEIADGFPDLCFKLLNTSYEVWPKLEWNKSHGLDQMLHLANRDPQDVLLLFAGDSPVDEEAFSWVRQRGGISILVGGRPETNAEYTLDSPAQLHRIIHQLAETKQG